MTPAHTAALTAATTGTTGTTPALAAAQDSVVGVFLQFGVLGCLVLVGLYFFNRAWKDQQTRAEKAEQALAEVNRDTRDKVVPVLATVLAVLKDAESALATVATVLKDAERAMADQHRRDRR